MNLGSQFPDIKKINVENVIFDKQRDHIEVLNLCVQLDYSGNFLLSIDAKMKFGKTAYLSIKGINNNNLLSLTSIYLFIIHTKPIVSLFEIPCILLHVYINLIFF